MDPENILIKENWHIAATIFNGTDYIILSTSKSNEKEFSITKVSTDGTIKESTPVLLKAPVLKSAIMRPALTNSINGNSLIAFSGWADSINTHPANTWRIKGLFYETGSTDVEDNNKTKNISNSIQIYQSISAGSIIIYLQRPVDEGVIIEVNIYNALGKLMKSIHHTVNDKFRTKIVWDGKNNTGKKLPAGIYFIQVSDKRNSFVRKIFMY